MKTRLETVLTGDCLNVFKKIKDESVDLVYLDPPYFTQKKHKLKTRDGENEFIFSDEWRDIHHYIQHLKLRLIQCKRVLKSTGSLFLHCDKTAVHYLKITLDEIFNVANFQSEIIWTYRRWSNAKKGLLNNHQSLLFYSKSASFKFKTLYDDYSPSTNVDQIVQLRERDKRNKSVYKKNADGSLHLASEKRGVPLGDVWDIPYLNPKAKERVGYPTQKPILLLERIIQLTTDEGDLVLDPYCGSGSTLVAAKLLNRSCIGVDQSAEAVKLTKMRLKNPVKSTSQLLEKGRASYQRNDADIQLIVTKLKATLVQRNRGIDGLITLKNQLVPFKVVKKSSELEQAIKYLNKSTQKNAYKTKALYCDWPVDKKLIRRIEKAHQVLVFNNLQTLNKKIGI